MEMQERRLLNLESAVAFYLAAEERFEKSRSQADEQAMLLFRHLLQEYVGKATNQSDQSEISGK